MNPLPGPLSIALPLPESSDTFPLEFRHIPSGSFSMGQRGVFSFEEPVHLVRIPDDFYLGTFPITQSQYRSLFQLSPERFTSIEGNLGEDPAEFKGPDRPVERVSWDDACQAAAALTESGLLPEGWIASLPSEAEWEFACRAGSDSDYWKGESEEALDAIGWYGKNAGGKTHPVGQKPGNPHGLHDLHGNVAEWCLDYFDPFRYRKEVDGRNGLPFVERPALEFGRRNARVEAIHEMLTRFVEGDRVLRGGDEATLQDYRSIANEYVENQAAGWENDGGAIDAALKLGEWPKAALSIAQGTHGWADDYLKGEANPDDPARVLRGAPGASGRRTAAQPLASGTRPACASGTSVSGLPWSPSGEGQPSRPINHERKSETKREPTGGTPKKVGIRSSACPA